MDNCNVYHWRTRKPDVIHLSLQDFRSSKISHDMTESTADGRSVIFIFTQDSFDLAGHMLYDDLLTSSRRDLRIDFLAFDESDRLANENKGEKIWHAVRPFVGQFIAISATVCSGTNTVEQIRRVLGICLSPLYR